MNLSWGLDGLINVFGWSHLIIQVIIKHYPFQAHLRFHDTNVKKYTRLEKKGVWVCVSVYIYIYI